MTEQSELLSVFSGRKREKGTLFHFGLAKALM